MTSAFETHSIDHISASSANLFAAAPALWVSKYLLKRDAPVGAAAHRGSAVEVGVAQALRYPEMVIKDCTDTAEKEYRNRTALSCDPRRETEGKAVPDITRWAMVELCAYGPGAVCQQRVEWLTPELPVPFLGYIDFYWPKSGVVRELKSTLKMHSAIRPSHARQLALYANSISDNLDAGVTYATPREAKTYRLENTREHVDALVKIGLTIERFLNLSSDPYELAALVVPDLESFYWNGQTNRQLAWELWGI